MMLLSDIAIFALHWYFSETFIRGSCEDKKKKKKFYRLSDIYGNNFLLAKASTHFNYSQSPIKLNGFDCIKI